ncbi:flagellar brake protein [Litoribrevibacter albus]|uniref:Pilus assembly protein PilZ n=1 Tax=Litoribrevibacter albus TaxID=1473156 RepID=A0AA37SAK2_9GAMM|nr:flagellar brake protein [Litoribrevibacter albus]GLQ32205.1 pilus assembly protein PilZ [Litoribrevibacter albus]
MTYRILKTPEEHYSVLRTIQDNRYPTTLSFHSHDQDYLTQVIKADIKNRCFFIDELKPPSGHKLAASKESFDIITKLNGVEIIIKGAQIVGAGKSEDGTFYKLTFPEEILYLQRRHAFRVDLPEDSEVYAEIRGDEHQSTSHARVLDVSATGCRVRLKQMPEPPFVQGEILPMFMLKISKSVQVEGQAELRFVAQDEKDGSYLLGIELKELFGLGHRTMERFVNELQRDARKQKFE